MKKIWPLLVLVICSMYIGFVIRDYILGKQQPSWILPLPECLLMQEVALKSHEDSLAYLILNPNKPYNIFLRTPAEQRQWVKIYKSSIWWLEQVRR